MTVRASLFAVGFLSLLGQVALLRELAVASFGVELIYLLALGLWLSAGAAGALPGRRGAADPPSGTGWIFLAVAFLVPLEMTFLRGSRAILGGVPGAFLPLGKQAATAALGLVPAGAALGMLFRRTARRLAAGRGTLAEAYAWECAGGAAGSAAATLSLSLGVPNFALGTGAGLLAAASAGLFGTSRRAAGAAAALFIAALAFSGPLDRATTAWNHPFLAATRDTPYGRITVTRTAGQVAVFESDALAFESEGTEAEEIVHLAALQAPAGPRVLALGGGFAGIATEVRKHRPVRVDYVEMNRGLVRTLLPLLPPGTRRDLEEPPVRTIFADPRRFLSRAAEADLILVAAPEPSSGQSNRFYTAEFFRLCAARLSPGGVIALRLPSSENFWTPGLRMRNGSVREALRSSFRDVLVIPGSTDILLGSQAPLVRDPDELARRLIARGIEARLVTPGYIRYVLTNDRVSQVEALLSGAGAPPNTDARPVCYQQTAVLWLGRFIPSLGAAGPPDRRAAGAALALAAVLVLAMRLKASLRRAGLVFAAGFSGMGAEAVVLLRFQAESGSLYQDIGLLLTSFMIGLAAGAFAFDRAVPKGAPPGRTAGAALLLALALFLLLLAAAASAGGAFFRPAPAALALALCGALTAGLFGYASRIGGDPREAAGPLYAADLLGGCLGSILAGLLLIPLAGTGAAAAGLALLPLAAILLL